jgi:hypothetical protein
LRLRCQSGAFKVLVQAAFGLCLQQKLIAQVAALLQKLQLPKGFDLLAEVALQVPKFGDVKGFARVCCCKNNLVPRQWQFRLWKKWPNAIPSAQQFRSQIEKRRFQHHSDATQFIACAALQVAKKFALFFHPIILVPINIHL